MWKMNESWERGLACFKKKMLVNIKSPTKNKRQEKDSPDNVV